MRLFCQSLADWSELDVRGITDDRVFAMFPDEWAVYEIDRKELETKGFAETHWDNFEVYTEAGKEHETQLIAEALANPTAKEFYVWRPVPDGPRWPSDPEWEKVRIINWTRRWIFADAGHEAYDGEVPGNIAWIDRKSIREKGNDLSTHGQFGTEAYVESRKAEARAERAKRARGGEEGHRNRRYRWSPHLDTRKEDAAALGLAENATRAEIIAAFKGLAKKHHPDVGGTTREFQRIVEAKDRLLNAMASV